MIDIKKLVLETKTVSIDFPGLEDFQIDLCYLGPEALKKLRDKCIVTKIDKKTREVINELDEDKFGKQFSASVIRGWRGLKASYLGELMLIDLQDNDPDDLVEYSEDNAYTLFTGSSTFARWVNEVAFDLNNFR
jgi:hypothetical protein